MSNLVPNDESVSSTKTPERWLQGIWLKELPYGLVLVLTLVGVAYTSFTKSRRRPIGSFLYR